MNRVAVIGGGASGIMAAITAQRNGAKVAILEKNARIGKKILMTGNGRCNFTNMGLDKSDYNSDFTEYALKAFSPKDTISFFKSLGMLSAIEAKGRVYPLSGQAAAVLDILLMEIERSGIKILSDFDVQKIAKNGDVFEIVSQDGKRTAADKVIIATGGMAAPKTGSCGSGYRLLGDMGHAVVPSEPILVQLKTDKGIGGVRATANVKLRDKEELGEVQFNTYGLSGIPIFNMSRYAKKGDTVTLDLVPDMTKEELYSYLKSRPNRKLERYLIGIINKTLGQMLLKDCNIGKLSRESVSLTDKEIMIIASKLKGWDFSVTGKMSWDNAQATKGGISLNDINPKTMESRIVSGLFVAGELLDIDAPCGGYNLQWAWSSGFLAGKSASIKEKA